MNRNCFKTKTYLESIFLKSRIGKCHGFAFWPMLVLFFTYVNYYSHMATDKEYTCISLFPCFNNKHLYLNI